MEQALIGTELQEVVCTVIGAMSLKTEDFDFHKVNVLVSADIGFGLQGASVLCSEHVIDQLKKVDSFPTDVKFLVSKDVHAKQITDRICDLLEVIEK